MRKIYERTSVVLIGLVIMVLQAPKVYANDPPVADAGLPRYVATGPVRLDGSGSYDPDTSDSLTYIWTQLSGALVDISDADTATPSLSGFSQTQEIQKCEFELSVSDGELTSRPDRVCVVVVPNFGPDTMRLENNSFDTNKPTLIYFGGGNCTYGFSGQYISGPNTLKQLNVINYPYGYEPDRNTDSKTYFHYGNMLIAYLSSVAPNYSQSIQTAGWSTGGQPAIDVAIHMNTAYSDARYAVNQVHFFDATPFCRNYLDYVESIREFLESRVDGELCWAGTYVSSSRVSHPGILNVMFDKATDTSIPNSQRHAMASNWYSDSLNNPDANAFNNGVVAGRFWSVLGPGKNLQLAFAPDREVYKFTWFGDAQVGHMELYDPTALPARLPEPVTLLGPSDQSFVDAEGEVLSCQISQNAVGYQLLFGRDPYHLVYLYSDTPSPPSNRIMTFPFEHTWWTIRAYDQYGSTIHADPRSIYTESVAAQSIHNSATGQVYSSIQQAVNDALNGDEIVLGAGPCQYNENIDFKGKSLTLRSTDPVDLNIVDTTVIVGGQWAPTITMSTGISETSTLDGLTIIGGRIGVFCRDTSPRISRCVIGDNVGSAIEFWERYEPEIVDCSILGDVLAVNDPRNIACWKLDETKGDIAYDSIGENNAMLFNNPIWQSTSGAIGGALELDGIDDYMLTPFMLNPADAPFSVFAWVKGGLPGQVIVSQTDGMNWLMADSVSGALRTDLKRPSARTASPPLISPAVITDGDWHRVGFVWDGSERILYVNDIEVARDAAEKLESGKKGLYLGCGANQASESFWSGLIDDVRIYDQAVEP